MRGSDGGFTLFEVLGAVAILAILYTTLSTVAIRGLRSEGESRRMLEASLLADWELSGFEMDFLDKGEAPLIGITENEEQDGFTVTWEVTPLQTKIFKTAQDLEQERYLANPDTQPAPVFAGRSVEIDEEAPPFLQVELRVTWFEAGNERFVTRTIFAVDEDAASKYAASAVLVEGRDEDAVQ
jgi:prepilin-type N-terminal cleavage/methylation domain-containing protein